VGQTKQKKRRIGGFRDRIKYVGKKEKTGVVGKKKLESYEIW